MKNLMTLLAIGTLAILTSCGGSKNATTTETQNSNRGRSNTEMGAVNRGNETTGRTVGRTTQNTRATSSTIGRREDSERTRTQQMYTDLKLNDAQINRFEREWKTAEANWKRSNRNGTMNAFERTENQDRIMRDILDDNQFQHYQEWARENPISN